MIELPEVETIRRDLDRDCVGKKIKSVEVKIARIAGGTNNKTLIEKSFDQEKVTSVRRIGMFICIDFSNELSLLFGLGTGGQMLRVPNKEEVNSRTGVVLAFTQQGQLRLIDNNGEHLRRPPRPFRTRYRPDRQPCYLGRVRISAPCTQNKTKNNSY